MIYVEYLHTTLNKVYSIDREISDAEFNEFQESDNPKELDDLEKEVEEKTGDYQEVVEKVNETEKKVKEIRIRKGMRVKDIEVL